MKKGTAPRPTKFAAERMRSESSSLLERLDIKNTGRRGEKIKRYLEKTRGDR